MKPINTLRNHLSASRLSGGTVAVFVAAAMASTARSAEVTLTAGNGIGATSFATALSWSNAAIPGTGNSYVVPAASNLRTLADSPDSFVFAGDSLSLLAGASLVYKGSAGTNAVTITIANFALNGATVNNASNNSTAFTLVGNILVAGTGTSTILANNATITVNAPIAGNSGKLLLQTNNTLGRQVVLGGASTYTGTIEITGASGVVLAPTGSLAFTIGANGVNNTVIGTGPVTFNGAFNIDLANAGDTIGNSWNLVNVSTLGETFGSTFSITGFTKNGVFWTTASGKYRFSEATGTLTRIAPDLDNDGMPDQWEMDHFFSLDEGPSGDYDNDLASNLLEYQSGTNPDDNLSFPDTDNDQLNDGWELFYFGNLAQNGAGDPDADFNTNAAEYAAGFIPNNKFSYPDLDDGGTGDGINDGWEVHYFGSISACSPSADSDGDLFTNLEEFAAGSDPTVQSSSPDMDGDGLADGWELKYFRIGAEDLASATSHFNGTDDPDSDGFSNLVEHNANTNPTLSTSVPSALAYWRFEERTAGVVPVGDNTGGNQANTVLDFSGHGNHMMTWRDYTSPTYSTAVPFSTVPLTSAANTASLAFARDGANLFITDNVYTTTGVELNSHVFNAYTIEASFNTTATNVWQVVIGKTGNPIGGQAPFSLKIRATDNKLIAGIVDGAGTAKEAVSTRAITTNTWFSAVVTASATELKLWIKGSADAAYVLEGTTAISGAFYDYPGVDAPWVIGLGKWNGVDADPFGGNIDEVRISPKVLTPAEFLVPIAGNDSDNDGLDDTWETNYFGGLSETASGDFDHDGTSNLLEYRLGLIPNNGASVFSAKLTGNTLTWPAVNGLGFVIQRSTSMVTGDWSDVGTVNTTGTTGTWTDTAPPVGKAFYRVKFIAN
ncbi:MAG: LamG domain-containing protein [Luteolibacter sp.]